MGVTKENFNYCFTVKDMKELMHIKNYEQISPDPEDYNRCVAREKYLEIESAIERNRCLFYNKKDKIFTDKDFNTVNIENLNIFPRVDIRTENEIREQIELNNAHCIINKEDLRKVTYWPEYYTTKRKLKLMTMQEYLDDMTNYFNAYKSKDGKMFVKTVYKSNHSVVIETEYNYMMDVIAERSPIIISEYIDIEQDSLGRKEYRCYVIEGNLTSISRYLDYEKHEVPQLISDFANEVISQVKGKLPESYVVDIALYNKDGKMEVDVIEFNSITASGRYVQNTI